MFGLYIHIPFCLRKCPYCDFYSVRTDPETVQLYCDAIIRNIKAFRGRDISADTVYFGGGTPSLLTPKQVYSILDCIDRNIRLHSPEITLEANPSSLTADKLVGYRKAGINRLSVGFQSANDSELEFIGRLHDAVQAKISVLTAYEAGFENISCDLMLGLKGQDKEALERSVNTLLSLPIRHISAYMLKLEPGTAFNCDEVRGAVADDDKMSDLYLHLCALMRSAGYEHYEISNFGKPGFHSRHNMKYWTLEPYIGIGAAAHSDFGGKRYACPKDINAFISSAVQENTVTDEKPNRLGEYIMLSLRTSGGINYSRLAELGGKEYADKLFDGAKMLLKNSLAVIGNDSLILTNKGFLVSNAVIVYLLGIR